MVLNEHPGLGDLDGEEAAAVAAARWAAAASDGLLPLASDVAATPSDKEGQWLHLEFSEKLEKIDVR